MQDNGVIPPQWEFQQAQQPEQFSPVATSPAPAQAAVGGVQWTASEFLSHHKNGNWYLLLVLAAVGISGIVYLLTNDWISSVTILLVAVLLAIMAARQPRTLTYQLDEKGLTVQNKHYPLAAFKSFSVVNEGALNSIMLLPLKRFAQGVSMYYAPEDEQAILDVLSAILPYEERHQDPVDKFMQRIRF